jgi:spore maturation protein CgeB
MKLVVFGLSVSSSWGNGHATLWRGLLRALAADGHQVVFFERDVPYYRQHRDLEQLHDGQLVLYPTWDDVRAQAEEHLSDADVGMVTSYCPDAQAACDLVLESRAVRTFYDLDTGVTLARLDAGEPVSYLPVQGLAGFDLVLSYTGGRALTELRERLGARSVAPLYGSVDPEVHKPAEAAPEFIADLSYLGTYSEDRQAALERLFMEPARRAQHCRFLIGGSLYPADFPWSPNVYFVRHVPPSLHSAFYCSSLATLNITRSPMAAMGYCPPGRLFEAAACGATILTDWWEGLDSFYDPWQEVVVCLSSDDVLRVLNESPAVLAKMAARARQRTLDCHTSVNRARELVGLLERAYSETAGDNHVGNCPGGRQGKPDSAIGVF